MIKSFSGQVVFCFAILRAISAYVGENRLSQYMSHSYVLPRLLFGLEVLPLTQTQINILSKFHISNLRRFQSLPIRTATCAVYLLIGALPLEAELHKRQLGLLYNILTCTNKTIRELSSRQIAFNLDNNQSYFSKVQDILNIYDLPNLQCLSEGLTSKEIWKLQVKRAINKHWSELLQKEALEKSTLKYMNVDSVGLILYGLHWNLLYQTSERVLQSLG